MVFVDALLHRFRLRRMEELAVRSTTAAIVPSICAARHHIYGDVGESRVESTGACDWCTRAHKDNCSSFLGQKKGIGRALPSQLRASELLLVIVYGDVGQSHLESSGLWDPCTHNERTHEHACYTVQLGVLSR